ncbi:MAG: tetratricopeptide repeat protein, partial [Nevskiales bacterium]
QGVDAAVRQYREIKAADPAAFDFDEDELDTLGYHLLHIGQFKNAVRIFQLNVEAHPQSGNAYDSLAEAYMDDGDKAQAIDNYRQSLQLKPTNRNAARMLRRLDAPTACLGGSSACASAVAR